MNKDRVERKKLKDVAAGASSARLENGPGEEVGDSKAQVKGAAKQVERARCRTLWARPRTLPRKQPMIVRPLSHHETLIRSKPKRPRKRVAADKRSFKLIFSTPRAGCSQCKLLNALFCLDARRDCLGLRIEK